MMLKIAHRGAAKLTTENSLQAFKLALELKAKIIEFDVRTTKDKEVIVFHDLTIDRLTNKKGKVSQFTLKEIREFKLKNSESIPTFQEVIALLKQKCICKIDIKDEFSVDQIVNFIINNRLENYSIITSEKFSILKKVRSISKKIMIEIGGYNGKYPLEKEIKKARKINANIISLHFSITNSKLVNQAHNHNLLVHVWTVNNKRIFTEMKKIGVDGITTDYPNPY